jgi:hypothetical protein
VRSTRPSLLLATDRVPANRCPSSCQRDLGGLPSLLPLALDPRKSHRSLAHRGRMGICQSSKHQHLLLRRQFPFGRSGPGTYARTYPQDDPPSDPKPRNRSGLGSFPSPRRIL